MYMYRLDSQRALTQGSRGRGEGGCSVWEGADAAWPGTMLQGKGQIFTTDLTLAVIMAAPRSVESWDIVVQRQGEAMFLDVREGSSVYDNIVNETAQEAREDDAKDSAGSVNNLNSMTQLNLEASYITYCYAQQCLDKTLPPETVKQEGKGGIGLVDAWNQRPREQEIPAGKVAYPPPPPALIAYPPPRHSPSCLAVHRFRILAMQASRRGDRACVRGWSAELMVGMGGEGVGQGEGTRVGKHRNWPFCGASADAADGFRNRMRE